MDYVMRYLILVCLVSLSTTGRAQEIEIPEDCEILEGWVTVWIDQIRKTREEIIYLKMDGKEPDSELTAKYEYVKYESERFSEAFAKRCDNQGFQPK